MHHRPELFRVARQHHRARGFTAGHAEGHQRFGDGGLAGFVHEHVRERERRRAFLFVRVESVRLRLREFPTSVCRRERLRQQSGARARRDDDARVSRGGALRSTRRAEPNDVRLHRRGVPTRVVHANHRPRGLKLVGVRRRQRGEGDGLERGRRRVVPVGDGGGAQLFSQVRQAAAHDVRGEGRGRAHQHAGIRLRRQDRYDGRHHGDRLARPGGAERAIRRPEGRAVVAGDGGDAERHVAHHAPLFVVQTRAQLFDDASRIRKQFRGASCPEPVACLFFQRRRRRVNRFEETSRVFERDAADDFFARTGQRQVSRARARLGIFRNLFPQHRERRRVGLRREQRGSLHLERVDVVREAHVRADGDARVAFHGARDARRKRH